MDCSRLINALYRILKCGVVMDYSRLINALYRILKFVQTFISIFPMFQPKIKRVGATYVLIKHYISVLVKIPFTHIYNFFKICTFFVGLLSINLRFLKLNTIFRFQLIYSLISYHHPTILSATPHVGPGPGQQPPFPFCLSPLVPTYGLEVFRGPPRDYPTTLFFRSSSTGCALKFILGVLSSIVLCR